MRYGNGIGFWVVVSAFIFAWPAPAARSPLEEALLLQAEWGGLLQVIEKQWTQLKLKLAAAGVAHDSPELDALWLKLGPQRQIKDRPLVLALMGSANTGKSTFLNLLIGAKGDQRVTRVSPVGGATTIPVAVLPPGFDEKSIPLLFGGFEVAKLKHQDDATRKVEDGKLHLLWTKNALVPPSIALVDTPDTDSYHLENADQTHALVNVADVVAVMVTDQYTNRDFVRALQRIADAKKPTIFIFPRADIEWDAKNWSVYIEELKKVTGVEVLGSFAVGNDPARAERGDLLDFYDAGKDGKKVPALTQPMEAVHALPVTALRIQAEWGAFNRALIAETGLVGLIQRVKSTNQALGKLHALFGAEAKVNEEEWPQMPSTAVSAAMLQVWEKKHRGYVTRAIRGVPSLIKKLGGAVFKLAYQSQVKDDESAYRENEFKFLREKVLDNIVIAELKKLRDSKKVTGRLAQAVEKALDDVSGMQEALRGVHSKMKLVDETLIEAIQAELDLLKKDNEATYNFFANADSAMAIGELLSPVALALSSAYVVGIPMMQSIATGVIAPYVQSAAGGTVAAKTAPMANLTGDRLRRWLLKKPLDNMVKRYAFARIGWLMKWLKENHLKDFYAALEATESATNTAELAELDAAVGCAQRIGEKLSALDYRH